MRVAANLRRIRQERGLSYAELARRLAALGHPILDTGILKIEKGGRRVDVDDLVALALALDTTPNRLLLPHMDIPDVTADCALTPSVTRDPREIWAWATGETPPGRAPASVADDQDVKSAEAVFNRENQPHRWEAANWGVLGSYLQGIASGKPPRDRDRRPDPTAIEAVSVIILHVFKLGMTTAQIRNIAQAAITAALLHQNPDEMDIRLPETVRALEVQISGATGGRP